MGETSGNLKELLGALCMGSAEYDASEIHRAVDVCIRTYYLSIYIS